MPVILSPEDYDRWLDPGVTDPAQVADLLKPYDPRLMRKYPVSDFVNRPDNEGPECAQETVADTAGAAEAVVSAALISAFPIIRSPDGRGSLSPSFVSVACPEPVERVVKRFLNFRFGRFCASPPLPSVPPHSMSSQNGVGLEGFWLPQSLWLLLRVPAPPW